MRIREGSRPGSGGGLRERWSKVALSIGRHEWLLVAVGAVVAGLVAGLLAPAVHKRADANALLPLYAGLLAVEIAILAVFAVRSRQDRRGSPAAIAAPVGIVGALACVAGMIEVPLGDYRFAFAVGIGCLLHGAVTLVRA